MKRSQTREAIAVHVESLLADGEAIPDETHPTIAATVVVTTVAPA